MFEAIFGGPAKPPEHERPPFTARASVRILRADTELSGVALVGALLGVEPLRVGALCLRSGLWAGVRLAYVVGRFGG